MRNKGFISSRELKVDVSHQNGTKLERKFAKILSKQLFITQVAITISECRQTENWQT